MPYWDAFANATLPLAASVPTLVLNTPSGTQTIDNPLYNYTFHANEGGNRFPSEHWVLQT
jgi:tyrosinase